MLAGDQPLVRAGLRVLIADISGIDVAGEAATSAEAVTLAALSLWLSVTGAPAEVAAQASNSARVLPKVYLHCIDSQEDVISRRIEDALDAGTGSSRPPQCVKASGCAHRRLPADRVRYMSVDLR
jgi:DNA-binding NarL/FixJ family response regulator